MNEIKSHMGIDAAHSAFKHVPFMGVAKIVNKAIELGYRSDHPEWCNFGVGQPEIGELDGAPARCTSIQFDAEDSEYGPPNGIDALRQAVADHYNRLFRANKQSQYTKDNVGIANGGRLMLTRVFNCLGDINLGYQTPDYTVYEDMLEPKQNRFSPVLLRADESIGFKITSDILNEQIRLQGLGAFVMSNPCNPTGQVIQGQELRQVIEQSDKQNCALIFDEFYSHYIYNNTDKPVSAAEHIDDVNTQQVLIIDGLTKNFRYPGWRLSWVLGPESVVANIGRIASSVDGGPSVPMQQAAVDILASDAADCETSAIRRVFSEKRQLMIDSLKAMNIQPLEQSSGTFYIWADISALPEPLNNAEDFSHACLQHQVITIPGPCFDVNPGKMRREQEYKHWVRFSYGPKIEQLKNGLQRLQNMLG